MKNIQEVGGMIFTKRGARVFIGKRPKTMSRSRYGLLINYYEWYRRNEKVGVNLSTEVISVKDLYYQFYENLKGYTQPHGSPSSYIKRREVLINPVGELRAYRYCLTDNGRKRLEILRKKFGKKKK